MAVISVNATETGWSSTDALMQGLARLGPGASVIIMIHGFRYSPWDAANDPHSHILSPVRSASRWKSTSWPKHLRLDRAGAGLGIGLGWHARGRLSDVAARAFGLGRTLEDLVRRVKSARPDLSVHLFGHSLGARVALSALSGLAAGDVARVVLLSGAEYAVTARAAMATPAGRAARVLNVTSRQNAVFDLAFRLCAPPASRGDATLSGRLDGVAGWTDLQIDCPSSRAALCGLGFHVRPARGVICHWSTYLQPGLFRLYRAVCDQATPDILDRLDAALARDMPKTGPNPSQLQLSPL